MSDFETDAVLDVCLGEDFDRDEAERRQDIGDDWERDVLLSDLEGEADLEEAEKAEHRALANVHARTELALTKCQITALVECGALRDCHAKILIAKLEYIDEKLLRIRGLDAA